MKKLALCLVLSLFATPALATTTWTVPASQYKVAKAACSTGTEVAPTGTVGLVLSGLKGFSVVMEFTGSVTAGTLQAYLYNPVTGNWARAPDLDLTVPASSTALSWSGFRVTSPAGRIAYLPSGLGVAVDIYIIGTTT